MIRGMVCQEGHDFKFIDLHGAEWFDGVQDQIQLRRVLHDLFNVVKGLSITVNVEGLLPPHMGEGHPSHKLVGMEVVVMGMSDEEVFNFHKVKVVAQNVEIGVWR